MAGRLPSPRTPVTDIHDRILQSPTVRAAALLLTLALLLFAPEPIAAQSSGLSTQEQELLDAVNRYRAEAGLPPLAVSPALTAAARWMADDLAKRDTLDHTDSMGRGIRARFSAFGYPSDTGIAENLHAGSSDAATAASRWMASEGHRENMLRESYTAAGVAVVHAPGTRYGFFWVITFGTRVEEGSQPPPAMQRPPATTNVTGFSQPFPSSGFALNTWNGGSVDQLVGAVANAGARSVFVSHQGNLVGHIVGAPAFVNANFAAAFPGGQVPAGTGLLVVV